MLSVLKAQARIRKLDHYVLPQNKQAISLENKFFKLTVTEHNIKINDKFLDACLYRTHNHTSYIIITTIGSTVC